MNRGDSASKLWMTTAGMLSVTLLLWFADRGGYLTGVRMKLLSVISPGRMMLLSIAPETAAKIATEGEQTELQRQLLQNELQRRELLIENARLRNQIVALEKSQSLPTTSPASLVDFVAVKAGVLSRSGLSDRLRELFIDVGRDHGLKESELVIRGGGLIVDQGTVRGIQNGQKVTQGTAVVGRISKASKWISLVQPITDPEFSAAVQIIRRGSPTVSFGARGLLEGTGESLCRLSGVPYTEAVSVGDEVVSASINSVVGPRLYFGRIVKAEFSDGGQWSIAVEPAFVAGELNEVSVVQQRVRPPESVAGASPTRNRIP